MITEETRLESYIQRPVTRAIKILQVMQDIGKPVTARQLAWLMGYPDLNAVKPRLTELRDAGKIYVAGKAYDTTTQRHVALWEVTK